MADDRTPAQFFFEMGFAACFAEAVVRNGDCIPFTLVDEDIERQWVISRKAYPDRAELEAMLVRASAQDELVEALAVGERFLNACNSAWAAGEPEHRVKTMLDLSDEFRSALDRAAHHRSAGE